MIASRVTPPAEEEEVEVEGTAEAAGSVVSIRGRFNQSWASLYQTKPALMAPIVV